MTTLINLLKLSKVNWKSSSVGIGILLHALGTFLQSEVPDYNLLVAEVITAIGLIFAVRDPDKSSQDNKIRP